MRFYTGLLLTLPLILIARENPFVPSVKYAPEKQTAPVVQEAVKTTQTTKPKVISTPIALPKKKKVVSRQILKTLNYEKVRFVFRERSVYIETKDKVIKRFSLTNPPSIVIDFKAKADFASKREVVGVGGFKKVEIGAHGNSYRVVLRLDKRSKYKVSKKRYGYVITLK